MFSKYSGRSISDATVFEVGYGAKPLRFILFQAMGLRIEGIDMDVPLIKPSLSAYARLLKQNGLERFAKSVLRNVAFDRKHYSQFFELLRLEGYTCDLDLNRLMVGDASNFDFEREALYA